MADEALFVVSLESDTGLPADQWVNNWAIHAASGSATEDAAARLGDFYEAIDGLLAHTINTDTPSTWAAYNLVGHLDGSPHGSPYDSGNLDWPAGVGANSLPSEVAMCLTLEGVGRATAPVEVGVTRPKSRRTGRVYLGPLSSTAVEEASGRVRLAATTVDTVLDAAEALVAGLITDGCELCVWSRADAVFYPLEAVSMDDALDTIRSRGERPTVRVRRSV